MFQSRLFFPFLPQLSYMMCRLATSPLRKYKSPNLVHFISQHPIQVNTFSVDPFSCFFFFFFPGPFNNARFPGFLPLGIFFLRGYGLPPTVTIRASPVSLMWFRLPEVFQFPLTPPRSANSPASFPTFSLCLNASIPSSMARPPEILLTWTTPAFSPFLPH